MYLTGPLLGVSPGQHVLMAVHQSSAHIANKQYVFLMFEGWLYRERVLSIPHNILTSLDELMSCFDPLYHFNTAGGLDPLLRHSTSLFLLADTYFSFLIISTFNGFTEKIEQKRRIQFNYQLQTFKCLIAPRRRFSILYAFTLSCRFQLLELSVNFFIEQRIIKCENMQLGKIC